MTENTPAPRIPVVDAEINSPAGVPKKPFGMEELVEMIDASY